MADKEGETKGPEGSTEKKGRGRPRKPKPEQVGINSLYVDSSVTSVYWRSIVQYVHTAHIIVYTYNLYIFA